MIELEVAGSDVPALVNDCWAHLSPYRWRLDKRGYVMRKAKGLRIYLHHVVLPGRRYPAYVRDHINRDKMDNRLENLRWVTHSESAQNKGPYSRKHNLGARGVTPIGNRYRSTATINGVIHRLGYFDDPLQAAKAASAWRKQNMPCSFEP